MSVSEQTIPQHVAVIMDGNGRWARCHGGSPIDGHRRGVDSLREVVRRAGELGVRYLTVYAFSTENWSRPADEVSGLMELLGGVIVREAQALAHNNTALRFIGDIEGLSDSLRLQIASAESIELSSVRLTLSVALNYSARWDIVRAARRVCAVGGFDVDQRDFAQYLSTAALPDVDLVIRTSGEQRLSNFLLWESSYAELYFTERLWPDFSPQDFDHALTWYCQRERRYGARDVV